jgi:hypothetical protein
MAISPKCDRCGAELTEFGAILLGPPDENNLALKQHLCRDCYREIVEDFRAQN